MQHTPKMSSLEPLSIGIVNEKNWEDILQKNFCLCTERIEPKKFVDRLYSNAVLDADEIEIHSNPMLTRKTRAFNFLMSLGTKGIQGFLEFIKVLEFTYPDLYAILTNKQASERPPVGRVCPNRYSVVIDQMPQLFETLRNEIKNSKELSSQLDAMKQTIAYLTKEKDEVERENDNLRNEQEKVRQLQLMINECRDENHTLMHQYNSLLKERDDDHKKKERADLAYGELKREYDNLLKKLNNTEEECVLVRKQTSKWRSIAKSTFLQQEPETDRNRREILSQNMHDILQKTIDDLQTQNEALLGKVNGGQEINQEMGSKIMQLAMKHDEQEKCFRLTETNNSELRADNERYLQLLINLQKEKIDAEHDRDIAQQRAKTASEELFQLKISQKHADLEKHDVARSQLDHLKNNMRRSLKTKSITDGTTVALISSWLNNLEQGSGHNNTDDVTTIGVQQSTTMSSDAQEFATYYTNVEFNGNKIGKATTLQHFGTPSAGLANKLPYSTLPSESTMFCSTNQTATSFGTSSSFDTSTMSFDSSDITPSPNTSSTDNTSGKSVGFINQTTSSSSTSSDYNTSSHTSSKGSNEPVKKHEQLPNSHPNKDKQRTNLTMHQSGGTEKLVTESDPCEYTSTSLPSLQDSSADLNLAESIPRCDTIPNIEPVKPRNKYMYKKQAKPLPPPRTSMKPAVSIKPKGVRTSNSQEVKPTTTANNVQVCHDFEATSPISTSVEKPTISRLVKQHSVTDELQTQGEGMASPQEKTLKDECKDSGAAQYVSTDAERGADTESRTQTNFSTSAAALSILSMETITNPTYDMYDIATEGAQHRQDSLLERSPPEKAGNESEHRLPKLHVEGGISDNVGSPRANTERQRLAPVLEQQSSTTSDQDSPFIQRGRRKPIFRRPSEDQQMGSITETMKAPLMLFGTELTVNYVRKKLLDDSMYQSCHDSDCSAIVMSATNLRSSSVHMLLPANNRDLVVKLRKSKVYPLCVLLKFPDDVKFFKSLFNVGFLRDVSGEKPTFNKLEAQLDKGDFDLVKFEISPDKTPNIDTFIKAFHDMVLRENDKFKVIKGDNS